MDQTDQIQAAAHRHRAATGQREKLERRQRKEGTHVVDTPEQVEARALRLVRSGQLPPEAVLAAVPDEDVVERHVVLERIIAGASELQPVNFLPRGVRAARTIARISLRQRGRLVPFGTGFLVAPRLLLTNNHVLPDAAVAGDSVAEFNCELDLDDAFGKLAEYALDPQTLFLTDEHLDYSLVAVRSGTNGRAPGEEFGWNRLLMQQGKIVTGEPVNVVGHPMGRMKEIALRNNELLQQLDDFLHYKTDTEPGNSGSPVFNDQWEVVALHHSGVPRTDAEGNILKPDGSRWRRQDGDAAIDWVANEGARVSVLLGHLDQRSLSEVEQRVVDELGMDALASGPSPAPVVETPARPSPVAAVSSARTTQEAGVRGPRAALGADTQLVYLHGRSQQGKNPRLLRAAWTAGLNRGLAEGERPPIDAAHAWFPFYGDAFADALDAGERSAPIDGEVEVAEALAPRDASARQLYETMIAEAAERAGMPADLAAGEPAADENLLSRIVGGLQGQLSWLASRSGLDDLVIAAAFRDVAAYLDRDAIRKLVLDSVLDAVPRSGRIVLVSHSLGTVVAMDLLTRLPDDVEVVRLVTAGSPLGMDSVFTRLLSGGPRHPERVGAWLNAWCAPDAVAIGCPLRDDWGSGVREVVTNNHKDRAHDIAEYLADPRVARFVVAG